MSNISRSSRPIVGNWGAALANDSASVFVERSFGGNGGSQL